MTLSKKNYQTNTEENNYILITVIILFIVSLILIISYIIQSNNKISHIQYFEIDNMIVQSKNYNVVTSFSVNANESGNEWLKKNQQSLLPLLQNIIYKTDMDRMSNSNKLIYLQNNFLKETQKNFPQAHVKEIIITDFLIQDN